MRFVFRLCKDLGIDDPVAWFNAAPPSVVDGWIAYYSVIADEENSRDKKSPEQALQQLMAGRR